MKIRLSFRMALAGLALAALAGCGGVSASSVTTWINDAKAILALNELPAAVASKASLVLTGVEALDGSYNSSVASGATNEQTALSLLGAAVSQVQADVPTTSKVYADANTALSLISTAQENTSESYITQIETDVDTVLLDYLALKQPTTATIGGATSSYATLLSDMQARLKK
jgi:hypothetical protein